MPPDPPPQDRTTATGLFNYARSYWRSAEQLRVSKPRVSHPDAPIVFLFYHAIELYLKAYVRSAGYTLEQIKTISHNIERAARAANKEGLSLSKDDFDLIGVINSDDNVIRSRYITTGAFTRPEDNALSDFCQHLDIKICERLIADGHSARSETFITPPKKPSDQQSLDDHLSEEIETLSEIEREILAYLLHRNQRMFTCAVDGGNAATLMSRGIVRRALQPGQAFLMDDMPVEIPLQIWRWLKEHADNFPYYGEEHDPHPWRTGW